MAGAALLAALTVVMVPAAGQAGYSVDFEGVGETKTGYATATVVLGGLEWSLTEALIGTREDDKKNGARGMRMRRNGDQIGVAEMLEDKTRGLGTLAFLYARYGTETDQPHLYVEYSLDGGESWEPAGETVTEFPDSLTLWRSELNLEGNVRVRFRTDTQGDNQRRFNIDDIEMSDCGVGPPLVTTAPIAEITASSAWGGGEVLDDQGAEVMARGLAWSTNANPTVDDYTVAAGEGIGEFTAQLTGLTAAQTYYVRAFASNSAGAGYGLQQSFTAAGFTNAPDLHSVTDRRTGGFVATWDPLPGAAGYRIDVASQPCFHPGGDKTLLLETMGTVTQTTAIEEHAAASGFDYSGIYSYGDGGALNPGQVRGTNPSSGYTHSGGIPASGGANIWLTSSAGEYGFCIGGIDTRDETGLRLGFGYRKESLQGNADLTVAWSTDNGAIWHDVAVQGLPPEDDPTGWRWIETPPLPVAAENAAALRLRWIKNGLIAVRIDDVVLQSEGGAATLHPVWTGVSVSGTVGRVTGLQPGQWWVRVKAVGAGDHVSPPSEPRAVEVPRSGTVLVVQ